MQFAFFSDTHLKVYKKNSTFYDNHIAPSLDFFYDECKKRKVNMIFHLGDFFHVKETIATEAFTKAYKFVEKISKLAPNYYLVGNHDSYMKDSHAIHLLESFKPLVRVFDMNYSFVDEHGFRFHFMPYIKEEEIKNSLKNEVKYLGDNRDFFFGHFGLFGFVMQQDNYTDQYSEINKGMFKKFKQAFFGHFHFHQRQGNCTYISSPFQSKHGDEQGEHGFCFYDTVTNKIEFVPNPHSPVFKTILLTKENVNEILNSKNHFWRIYYHPDMSKDVVSKLKEKIIETNYNVQIAPMEITEKQDFKIPVIEEWQQIVHKDADEILLEWYKANQASLPYTQEEMFSVF